MINKQNKAFTMAEVLVTLLIIGVVAAVTIPGLRESTDQSGNIALAKKAYATASNAFAQLQATYGPVLYWTVPQNAPASITNKRVFVDSSFGHEALAWMFKSKMNVSGSIENFSTKHNMYLLPGGEFRYQLDNMIIQPSTNFQTADGMYWLFSSVNQYCSFQPNTDKDAAEIEKDIAEHYQKLCALIMVDTNGPKKPNRVGLDIYVFDITTQGVVPHYGNDCNLTGAGYSCSEAILSGNEKALDFIYE